MLRAASLALLSVSLVALVSIGIIYWTEQRSDRTALAHKSQVARERLEEPIRIVTRTVSELARTAMFTTAILDSGGRAAYARPFLQNYAFPVPAANGIALCDINGKLLAGSRELADCHGESDEFRRVLADGKARHALTRARDGRRLWTVYHGVAFAYTGTTEGVAVGQLDLEALLRPLPQQLGLRSVQLRRSGTPTAEADTGFSLDETRVVRLFEGNNQMTAEPLEFVLESHPGALLDKLLPLLLGYFLASLGLVGGVLVWARRGSRALTQPLLALRDSAHGIAASGDLSRPIPRAGADEVGQLAESIDSMVRAIRTAEATRREAEARFRLMFETSSEAIIFAWPDGRVETANSEALRMFGYSMDELRALGRSGVMDVADPRLPAALEQRARNGSFRGELRCRRKDGSLFPVEIVSTIFADSRGELRSSSMFRDITDQKLTHDALRASLETLRSRENALAAISQGVLISGPDRRITYASEAFERITGYVAGDIIGRSCKLLQGPDTSQETLAWMRARLNAGESFHGEILNYRKDGTPFWNDLSITPIFDSADVLTQFVGVQRDISERKKAEQTLQASQALIKTVFDSLDEQIVVLDPQGVILAANSAWQRFGEENGAPQEVIEGVGLNYLETCESAVSSSDVNEGALARAGIAEVLSGRSPQFSLEYPCHSQQRQRWFRMQAITLQGPRCGAVVIHENITERIENAKRLKALSKNLVEVQESARRHLAGELHDRTSANLAAIGINLEVAGMALQARDWQVIAERMEDNRALIDDTSASIREICAELRPPALDYAGLIPAIESYANLFTRRTGIAIRINNSSREERLTSDIKSTLFRIVQEALTNVAKHAEAGTIVIELALDSQPLRLSVSDDGQGFDLSVLSQPRGLGILNIREMAEFSGGSFELASTPGGGTRIGVELPIAEA